MTGPAKSAPAWRPTALWVSLALLPLWLGGMFGRGFWTPDEPREADIAWNMSFQTDWAVPQLAGLPFLEKPPLLYWAAAPLLAQFGPQAWAARLPNLLYALLAICCVVWLAWRCGGGDVAASAGLVAGSFLLALQVAVWFATDAPLVAAVALSLLGLQVGLSAAPGRAKLLGYSLFQLGLALAFLAKNVSGWMVPLLALSVLLVWQQRWSELKRWEFWAPGLLLVAIIAPWVIAISQGPDGPQQLQAFFWWNLAGRFTDVGAPASVAYAKDHQNSFGKYFVEAPINLLPWSLLALAAVRRGWRVLRSPAHSVEATRRQAWQLAVAAFVPALLLLSISTTARAVYAAPLLPALALGIGLWAAETGLRPDGFDREVLRATVWLNVALLAVNALVLPLLLRAHQTAQLPISGLLGGYVLLIALSIFCARRAAVHARAQQAAATIRWVYAGFAAWLLLTGLTTFGWIDRSQDLQQVVRSVRRAAAGQALVLFRGDETTRAILHMYAPDPAQGRVRDIRREAELLAALRANPTTLVLVKARDYTPGPIRGALAEFGVRERASSSSVPDVQALLQSRVLQLDSEHGPPDGRRYWLLRAGAAPRTTRPDP